MHDVEPAAENCPLLQPTQALDPDAAEKVSLKQLVQLPASAAE